MNFDIEALSIVLNTNIPDAKYKSITFTRKMLYVPEDKKGGNRILLNDYPYFTQDVLYPRDNLVKFSYQDRVDFFFNLDRFNQLLTPYMENKLDSSKKDDEYYKKRQKNIDKNIMTMLLLLFPTKYPMINELYNSYDYVLTGRKKIEGMLYNPFATQLYSYLDIGGKKYTIKSVAWLNDIMNHPIYNEFLREYRDFEQAATEKIDNAKKDLEDKKNEIINIIEIVIDKYIDGIKQIYCGVNQTKNLSNIAKPFVKVLYMLAYSIKCSNVEKLKQESKYIMEFDIDEYKIKETQTQTETEEEKKIQTDIQKKIEKENFKTFDETYVNYYNKILNGINILVSIITATKQWTSLPCKTNDKNINYIKTLLNSVKTRTNFETYIKKLNNTEGYFKKTFEELETNSQVEAIRKFYILLRRLRGVIRQSSNHELQKLLNLSDPDHVAEFYDFLRNVSNYMRSEKIQGSPVKLTDKHKPLIDVGLSFINMSVSDNRKTPRREIYVMIDLIDGIVNDNNWQSINCSYLSEFLGNEFETFGRSINIQDLSSLTKPSTVDWRIDKNRMLFSIQNQGFSSGEKASGISNAVDFNKIPNAQESSTNDRLFQFKYDKNVDIKNFQTLNEDFIKNIANDKNVIDPEVKKLNAAKNKISGETSTEEINSMNLLKYLIDNNDTFKNILKSKDSSEKIQNIIKAGTEVDGLYQILDLKNKQPQLIATEDEKTKNERNYKMAMYNLYKEVIKKMKTQAEIEMQNMAGQNLSRGGNSSKTMKKKYPLTRTHKRLDRY